MAVKTTPAMNHNRPNSVALGVRCLPHEGEHRQRVFWNTHVRPLGIMVLSYYASTRPPFLGTLQEKNSSVCKQPTFERQLFIILFMYLIVLELVLPLFSYNIPPYSEYSSFQREDEGPVLLSHHLAH